MKHLLCYLFGHKYIILNEHDNGRSKFREFFCQRCDGLKQTQYDYVC